MLAALGRLLVGGPERKARRLARDARTVVAMVTATSRAATVEETARQIAELVEGSDAVEGDQLARERWLGHMRSLHTEARRSHEQVALSALTLAIIELEARPLGHAGDAARAIVAEFASTPPIESRP